MALLEERIVEAHDKVNGIMANAHTKFAHVCAFILHDRSRRRAFERAQVCAASAQT